MITPRNTAPAMCKSGRREAASSSVFKSTRSMMNRMKSGSIICSPAAIEREHEDGADGVTMRPEPAEVFAEILAAFARRVCR